MTELLRDHPQDDAEISTKRNGTSTCLGFERTEWNLILWKGELLAFFMLRFWFSLNGSTMNGEIMDGKSHFSEPDNKGCDAAERENWSISWLGWMGDKSDELTAIEERKDFNGICREKMSMKNCLRMQKTRFHSLSQLPDAPSFLLLSFLRPR